MSKEPPDDTSSKDIHPSLSGLSKGTEAKPAPPAVPFIPIKDIDPTEPPVKKFPSPPSLSSEPAMSEINSIPPTPPLFHIPLDSNDTLLRKQSPPKIPFPSPPKTIETDSNSVKPFPSEIIQQKPALPQIPALAKPVALRPTADTPAFSPLPLPSPQLTKSLEKSVSSPPIHPLPVGSSKSETKPALPQILTATKQASLYPSDKSSDKSINSPPSLPLPTIPPKVSGVEDLDFSLPVVKLPKLAAPAKTSVPSLTPIVITLASEPKPSIKPEALTPTAPQSTASLSDFLPNAEVKSLGSQKVKKIALDPTRKKRESTQTDSIADSTAQPSTPDPIPLVAELESIKPLARTPSEKKPFVFWGYPAVITLILFLLVVAVSIYYLSRETSLIVNLSLDDMTMMDVPAVIYNFDGQVSQVKRDYLERRKPMDERLSIIESDLASAKADLAGREEKRRLLTQEIFKLKQSIPILAAEGEDKLNRLWSEEGGNLDKTYNDQKESLHQEIEKRATDLGLKYQRNPDLDAIEVAVNAFRLSLYGAPKTVNVDDQRIFSEDLLKRWKDFEKEWAKQQLAIKDKAMVIKQSPGPKIELAQKSIETLKIDLEALDIDLASLQEEVNRRQEEEVEEQEKLREIKKPFIADLLKIPSNNILKQLPIDKDGKITLRKLQKSTDLIPGDYLFFIQAQNQEEIYWAIKPFTITKYKKSELTIKREDFKVIPSFLE